MPAFVIRFQEPADPSGVATSKKEEAYSIAYDFFYEHYVITTTFSNSNLKPVSMNTLEEVKQFLHSLYKYVNLDFCVNTGNYIAYAQIDAGMMPTIIVPRRKLLEDYTVMVIDEALDVWAKITVPGIEFMQTIKENTANLATQPAVCPAAQSIRDPYACCRPGGFNYERQQQRTNVFHI